MLVHQDASSAKEPGLFREFGPAAHSRRDQYEVRFPFYDFLLFENHFFDFPLSFEAQGPGIEQERNSFSFQDGLEKAPRRFIQLTGKQGGGGVDDGQLEPGVEGHETCGRFQAEDPAADDHSVFRFDGLFLQFPGIAE